MLTDNKGILNVRLDEEDMATGKCGPYGLFWGSPPSKPHKLAVVERSAHQRRHVHLATTRSSVGEHRGARQRGDGKVGVFLGIRERLRDTKEAVLDARFRVGTTETRCG